MVRPPFSNALCSVALLGSMYMCLKTPAHHLIGHFFANFRTRSLGLGDLIEERFFEHAYPKVLTSKTLASKSNFFECIRYQKKSISRNRPNVLDPPTELDITPFGLDCFRYRVRREHFPFTFSMPVYLLL